jgi:pyrroloquinoline-quinone synthase
VTIASPVVHSPREFRGALEAAVARRHCADHPMTEKWVKGELSRNALKGWAVEHYHWVSNIFSVNFEICARAPRDVIQAEITNYREETDEARPHLDIVLRFAEANGADPAAVKTGRGLPTTESWVRFLCDAAREPSWIAGMAAIRIGTESQSPRLYGKVLPALRQIYKYAEPEIEHFWLHADVDIEHGGAAFDLLEKHCTTREQQDLALHWAAESARMRWFYFDGIHLHYELGYALA